MATMDAKQLYDIGKQISKAIESGDTSATILQILAPLEHFKATEDLLRQSKIGVAVSKLRPNKDSKVASKAASLVNRWKQEVNSTKKKRLDGTASPAPAGKAALNGRSSGTNSPAPPSKPEIKKEQRANKVDPGKRNTKTDGIEHEVTGDRARDGCLKLMYDGIAYLSDESPDAIFDVARRVEVAAFEHFKKETSQEYKAKMRSLYQNLKMKGNTLLRRDVYTMKIPPKRFVSMTSDELKSEEMRKEDAALEKENMNKAMTAQEEKAISTTFQCGKLHGLRKSLEILLAMSESIRQSPGQGRVQPCDCFHGAGLAAPLNRIFGF
ncbi:hypothetical protein AC578_10252 [Pseudocercospora eumusae]|uniref:TFIIS N-terminal domain-containing protein n=1 Tax=Pseudocercospora eumusae TaxID=321146 RepID=A0A139HYN3_9PEZI|nr:hypothetical protein AC578_10252 [Pseudocercospora eumusae]